MEEDQDPQGFARVDIQNELLRVLTSSASQHKGSFAAIHPFEDAPNPGLKLDGLGTIGLPLSTDAATEIIKACSRAPYGKGTETVLDDTVRKTWELDATKVRCS